MYKIYRAETVDEAIAHGLEELNVSEEDIKIDVEESGSKGFLGIGKKDSAVRLTVINPELKTYDSIEALISRDAGQKGSKPAGERAEEEMPEEDSEESSGDTADTEESADEEEHKPQKTSHERSVQEAAEATNHYIREVVTAMNIENSAVYSVDQNEVSIEFQADLAAKLIGKRGQTLNALQEIAQNYFNSIYKSYGAVVLDVENYRMKRRETLENLAVNMSKKALRTNEVVKLEPMPSFERKIMHNVLSELEDIKTYSQGTEPDRFIVIEKK